jgi:hypothetical protein
MGACLFDTTEIDAVRLCLPQLFSNSKGSGAKFAPVMESGARIKMVEDRKGRVSYVIGPDGSPLTLADLPPPGTRRWVIRRKAEVVAAVRGGLLSLDDACKRYTLTVEEFLAWQRAIERFGMPGLRATRVQQYRN